MKPDPKKDLEIRILRCIYDEDDLQAVTPSESPDFVVRRRDGGRVWSRGD